jgi:hypothetical protein
MEAFKPTYITVRAAANQEEPNQEGLVTEEEDTPLGLFRCSNYNNRGLQTDFLS